MTALMKGGSPWQSFPFGNQAAKWQDHMTETQRMWNLGELQPLLCQLLGIMMCV